MLKKTIYNYLKLINHLLKIFDLRIIKRRPSFDELISKLIDSKKVRKKIIKLKQDINKPDFGRI